MDSVEAIPGEFLSIMEMVKYWGRFKSAKDMKYKRVSVYDIGIIQ